MTTYEQSVAPETRPHLTGINYQPELTKSPEQTPQPQAEVINQPGGILFQTLRSPETDSEQRKAAAASLLDSYNLNWDDMNAYLLEPLIRAAVIDAASQNAARSSSVLTETTPASVGPDDRQRLIAVVAQERTQASVQTLIGELQYEATRQPAFDALVLLTGRADLGPHLANWSSWSQTHVDLTESEWQEELLSTAIRRLTTIETRLHKAERTLADAFRRLYLVTQDTARPALLIELMTSDQQGLRSLGFELADRELAANATLDSSVADAAVVLVEHSSATTRASAARLVSRLAPGGAAEVVTRALVNEEDAAAADALLLAAARWPNPELVEPMLRWIGTPSTAESACQTGVALYEAGLILSDDARERIRAVLTPIQPDASTTRLMLVAQTGIATDREEIAALLLHETPRVRLAAAEALARTPAGIPVLIESLRLERSIVPDVLTVLAKHDLLDQIEPAAVDFVAWAQSFEQATNPRVRATLATHILTHFDEALTDDQRAVFQAATTPGG